MTSIPTSTFSLRSLLPAGPSPASTRQHGASTTKATSSQQQNSSSCSTTSSFPASISASIATQAKSAGTVNSPASSPSQYTHAVLACLHALRLNDPQISTVAYEFLHPSSSTYVRPLLLQARPGTGKTLTLAARIAFFIAYHRIPPIQILAITFTKQAAAELRQRIDKLAQVIPSPSSSLSELEACDSAAGVTICNFHQMALLLLRRHSSLFGAQFALSIITTEETTKVIGELVRQRLIQEEQFTAATSVAALSADAATQAFTQPQDATLPDHKDRKMTEEEQETMQVIEELEQQQQQNQPDGTVLTAGTSKLPTTTPPSLTSILNSSRFAAAAFSALVDQQKHKYTTTQVLAVLLKQRQKGLELQRLPTTARLMFVTPTSDLCASPEFDEDAETDPVVMDIFHQYDTLLHQRNQLSLADLLPALIALFRYDPSIVQQCQHLFRYIFVDEFQDTTSLDVKALLALIGHPNWDQVKYNKVTQRSSKSSTNMSVSSSSSSSSASLLVNHLTVVGDPQQSVYGFRGADGHAFDLLQQALHPYGAISLRLTQNYRSTQTIIQAANSIMEYNACKPPPRPPPADTTTITTTTVTTKTTATGTTTSTTTTTATVPSTSPPLVPTAVSLNASGAMWSSNPQGAAIVELVSSDGASQARSIVEQIQRLTRTGVYQYHQIAVLARTNADVEQLRRCLKDHHIPMHSKRRKPGFSYRNFKKKQRLRLDLGYDEDEDEDVTDIENMSRRSSPCKAANVSPRVQAYQKQFTTSMKTAEWKEALAYCRVLLSAYAANKYHNGVLSATGEVDNGSQLADTSLRYLLTVFSSASVAKQILLSLTDIQEQYTQKQRRRRSKIFKREPGGTMEDRNDECVRNACDVALVCMEESVRYHQQQPSAATELQQWLRNKVEKTLTKPQYLSLSIILDRIGHLQARWQQKLQQTNRPQQETAAVGLLMSIILQCMQSDSYTTNGRIDGFYIFNHCMWADCESCRCCAVCYRSPEQWLQQSTPLGEKKTSTHNTWLDDDDDDIILPSFALSFKHAARSSPSSAHTYNTQHIHALQVVIDLYKANHDISLSTDAEPHSSSASGNTSSSSFTQASAIRSLHRFVRHIDTGNVAELYGLELELETRKKHQKSSSSTCLATIAPSRYTGVFVSTIHKAKGLEWPVVFVASFNEEVLPVPIQHICPCSHNGVEGMDDLDEATLNTYAASGGRVGVGCSALREEARVAYVAVTRAQVQLFVSYITHDPRLDLGIPMQPSRFLLAIPKHLKQQQQSSQQQQQSSQQQSSQQQQTHHQYSPASLGEVLKTGMLLFPRIPHPSPEFRPASQLGKRHR